LNAHEKQVALSQRLTKVQLQRSPVKNYVSYFAQHRTLYFTTKILMKYSDM